MDFSLGSLMNWFENAVSWITENRQRVIAGISGICMMAIGVGIYHYYANKTKAAAYKDFSALMQMVSEPAKVTGTGGEDLKASVELQKWERVEKLAQSHYNSYKGVGLGAAFLAVRADALDVLGNTAEAVKTMRQAVSAMGVAPIRECYEVKLALMLMDQTSDTEKKEGYDMLIRIGNNPKHMAHDRALYYLGEYAWIQRNFTDAKNYWQQLVIKYGSDRTGNELAEKAKHRLELLAV